ncbi:MAG: acyloxyacyl hydrolase [Bacteroidales bacterium]|nr:acyloxyacyl hydrolase [Bacteroidales bacterium]
MRTNLILIVSGVLICTSLSVRSETPLWENVAVMPVYHFGYVTPHVNEIRYYITEPVHGFDVLLSKSTTGKNYWEQYYNRPDYGVGFHRINMGNPHILGNSAAIFGFFQAPYFRKSNFSLSYSISFGLAHTSKTFDIENNPLNMAISSHINVFIRFGLHLKYMLNDHFEINGGLDMQHFSNGKLKTPNLGINMVTASVGLGYTFNKTEISTEVLPAPEIKRNNFALIYAAGAKTYDDLHNDYYFASSLTFHYSRPIKMKYSLGTGADIFYNRSLLVAIPAEKNREVTTADLFRAGIHVGGSLRYNNLSMIAQIGYYLYKKYYYVTPFYNRVGLRYNLGEHMLLNLTLKSHMTIADFVEWGVGYRW